MKDHDLEIDQTDCELTFQVSGTPQKYRPAKVNCDPDDAHEAEGGVCDDLEVVLINKDGKELVITDFLGKSVLDELDSKLYQDWAGE